MKKKGHFVKYKENGKAYKVKLPNSFGPVPIGADVKLWIIEKMLKFRGTKGELMKISKIFSGGPRHRKFTSVDNI